MTTAVHGDEETDDRNLIEDTENLYFNIKREALSPNEDASNDPEEAENVPSSETDLEPMENVIYIKREVLDEERNVDPLIDYPVSLHEEIHIKEEPTHEEENASSFKQNCEDIRKGNKKKLDKHNFLNFPVDCTEVLPRKKVKRKNECEGDRLMQSAMKGLQILQNHLARPPEDHIDTFMHYIGSELREIKTPVNVMEAKQAIFNVVYNIRKRELE